MKVMNDLTRRVLRLGIALLATSMVGCGDRQPAPAAQPPEVGVVTLEPRRVSITSTLPGRTAAFRVAEVRPQVSGIVQKRLWVSSSQ